MMVLLPRAGSVIAVALVLAVTAPAARADEQQRDMQRRQREYERQQQVEAERRQQELRRQQEDEDARRRQQQAEADARQRKQLEADQRHIQANVRLAQEASNREKARQADARYQRQEALWAQVAKLDAALKSLQQEQRELQLLGPLSKQDEDRLRGRRESLLAQKRKIEDQPELRPAKPVLPKAVQPRVNAPGPKDPARPAPVKP